MPKRSAPTDTKERSNHKRGKTSTSSTSKSDMSSLKRIIVVGLDGRSPGLESLTGLKSTTKPPSPKPNEPFPKILADAISNAKESGLELEILQVHPANFPTELEKLKKKLEAKPEGLMIGNGIRGTADYTVFFEDLVNAAREITPGTRMAFNTSPHDIVECCRRNFPQV